MAAPEPRKSLAKLVIDKNGRGRFFVGDIAVPVVSVETKYSLRDEGVVIITMNARSLNVEVIETYHRASEKAGDAG